MLLVMELKRHDRKIQKHLDAIASSDPAESAEAMGLQYMTDEGDGIRRIKQGDEFNYMGLDGEVITDSDEIKRIQSLGIPPAWENVWICPAPNGHLQATGRDAKGRKQYRYHVRWRSFRDQTKFTRMIAFSEAIPRIRERIAHDLALSGLPRNKVLATVVQLMELTRIRVGNEEYAKTNKSFGLTTMRDRHVKVDGSTIRFKFRGKSGVEHEIELNDRRLARIVKRCQDIPGQELFQYIDADGQRQSIDSSDINTYLRDITGQDFTAKDFRTWAGTVLAARELHEIGACESATAAKKAIVQAVKTVAQHLGNRPATCRKYYVHPAILDAFELGSLFDVMATHLQQSIEESPHQLRCEEQAVVLLLKQQLIQEIAA
ncbi:MAG: DNA topoisomerase IB [Leptolyngbyaceae cyanobacterium bins.302]|nr:DNA topoisomerase IB [Leptolyngbyaceae cyanobacterium bins.302]